MFRGYWQNVMVFIDGIAGGNQGSGHQYDGT